MLLSRERLKKYYNPENFFNRDLSWLEFNRRVLEEALNPNLPLLDRIKFISIFFSNLDEFYMIKGTDPRKCIRYFYRWLNSTRANPINRKKTSTHD